MASFETSLPLRYATVSIRDDAEGFFARVGDWFIEVRDGELIVRSAKRDLRLVQVPVSHAD